MSESPNVSDRVPGFIYLDMERVKSISARIDQGYIREQIQEREESEEVAASIYGSIKAHIFGSVGPSAETGAEVTGGFASASRSQETRALHHYYYNLLEEWLADAEGNWYHEIGRMMDEVGGEAALPSRVRSQVSEGDLILTSGTVDFLDFKTSMDLMSGFFTGIERLEEFQTKIIQNQLNGNNIDGADLSQISELGLSEFQSLRPLFETLQAVLPEEYHQMVAAELSPIENQDNFHFWATIQREKLETSPVELLSKHQSSEIPNCTMLARVESITEENMEETQVESTGDDLEFGELLTIADDIGSDFGLKVEYPNVSVSPVAIYR